LRRDSGEKISCCSEREYPGTINKKQLGDLDLSDGQEDQWVAFLRILSDEYELPPK
jgi:hypothetical protein